MILSVDMRSRTPIYEQLTATVREQAMRGILSADEPLPSVRRLAAELAVNPNTIQKAYNELERQGIVYSIPGRGSFISENIGTLAAEENNRRREQFRQSVIEQKYAGVTEEELVSVIREVYKGGISNDNG